MMSSPKRLGLPAFYGRNMDAWIDCMTCLDDANAGMSAVHAPAGGVLTLQLENVDDFAARCPIQYAVIIECAAFVNWRRIELGSPPVLGPFISQKQLTGCGMGMSRIS